MSTEQITAFVEHGVETGCVEISELNELVDTLHLGDEEVSNLYEQLEEHHVDVNDDCGREKVESTYINGDLAHATTDALQLFLNEMARYPLLTAEEEVAAGEADRARRQGGEGPDDQLEPPPRRLDREEVPGPRPLAARPDPGRDHRADPRRREVRLAQGLQVLDLRDVVDPPGRAARRREQGADDPDAGAHRRPRAEDLEGRARAAHEARPRADASRRSPRMRSCP